MDCCPCLPRVDTEPGDMGTSAAGHSRLFRDGSTQAGRQGLCPCGLRQRLTEHILPSAGSYGQVLNCKANIPDNRFLGTDDLKPRQQKTPSLSWATQLLRGLKICGGLKENYLPWPVGTNTWSPVGCAVCGAYGDFGPAPALSPSGPPSSGDK